MNETEVSKFNKYMEQKKDNQEEELQKPIVGQDDDPINEISNAKPYNAYDPTTFGGDINTNISPIIAEILAKNDPPLTAEQKEFLQSWQPIPNDTFVLKKIQAPSLCKDYLPVAMYPISDFKTLPEWFAFFDQTIAHTNLNGKREMISQIFDKTNRTVITSTTTKNTLIETFDYHKITDPAGKSVNPFVEWLKQPNFREYDQEIFIPNKTKFDRIINGCPLNLWQGNAFHDVNHPDEDVVFVQFFLEHMFNVLCDRNEISFKNTYNFVCEAYQSPKVKAGFALVLCGCKGSGKNIFTDILGVLFGQYYKATANMKNVTGNYTGHARTVCLQVIDEYKDDKNSSNDAALKSKVTSSKQTTEEKYKDAVFTSDYTRIIITTDNENTRIVKTSIDERRYSFIKVSGILAKYRGYFIPLGSNFGISLIEDSDVPVYDLINPQVIKNFEKLSFLFHNQDLNKIREFLKPIESKLLANQKLESNPILAFTIEYLEDISHSKKENNDTTISHLVLADNFKEKYKLFEQDTENNIPKSKILSILKGLIKENDRHTGTIKTREQQVNKKGKNRLHFYFEDIEKSLAQLKSLVSS